jgi:chromosome segregation ATPase
MSEALNTLNGAIDLLSKLYESPSLAHDKALPLIDQQLPKLREALNEVERIENSLNEWRSAAQEKDRHLSAVRSTARTAIGHLQFVLNTAHTHSEQHAAESLARDWLVSIGSEPN